MLEQKTLQAGLSVFDKYGPIEGTFVIGVVVMFAVQIWQTWNTKQNAVKPVNDLKDEVDKLRNSKGIILEDINKLKIEIERRVTFTWVEQQLLTKMDGIQRDVHNLMQYSQQQVEVNKELATSIKELKTFLSTYQERLIRLEERVN